MEQVLSSPRGHSDWEADQNSFGFLILDTDNDVVPGSPKNAERHQKGEPPIVSLSFDEIFQENAFSLDDLFRASRYSGLEQTYPWERSTECVSPPRWDNPSPQAQELAEEVCCAVASDVDTGDLISFNSTAPSPTHTGSMMQMSRPGSPLLVSDCLHPLESADTGCPLDGLVGHPLLEPLQDHMLSHTWLPERTTVIGCCPDLPSQVRDFSQDPYLTTPEQVRDLLYSSADLREPAGNLSGVQCSGRWAPCELELPSLAPVLLPGPITSPSFSSPTCSHLHPLSEPTYMALHAMVPTQSGQGSCGLLQLHEAETAGLSDASSAGNTIDDCISESLDTPQSSAWCVHERTLAGSDSEATAVTSHTESVSPASAAHSLLDQNLCELREGHPGEGEESPQMEIQMDRDVSRDDDSQKSLVHDLELEFALASVLVSPESAPEQTVPSCVMLLSPQPDSLPECSGENQEFCLNIHTLGTGSLTESLWSLNGDISEMCHSISPHADDTQIPEPLAYDCASDSESQTPWSPASESQAPAEYAAALEIRETRRIAPPADSVPASESQATADSAPASESQEPCSPASESQAPAESAAAPEIQETRRIALPADSVPASESQATADSVPALEIQETRRIALPADSVPASESQAPCSPDSESQAPAESAGAPEIWETRIAPPPGFIPASESQAPFAPASESQVPAECADTQEIQETRRIGPSADSVPASECQAPADSIPERRPTPATLVTHAALDHSFDPSAEPIPETDTTSPTFQAQLHTSPIEPEPCEPKRLHMGSLFGDAGSEQTIDACVADILVQVAHTLSAAHTHSPSPTMPSHEVLTCPRQSETPPVNGATRQCWISPSDSAAENTQVPDASVDSSTADYERTCTRDVAPAGSGTPGDPNPRNITAKDCLASDEGPENTHALAVPYGQSCVNTPAADSMAVLAESSPLYATLPAPVVCVQEDRDSDQEQVRHSFESLPGRSDSSPPSGEGSQLTKVGVAVEEGQGRANARLTQSAVVSAESDPPGQSESELPRVTHTQPNLSQVAGVQVNALLVLRDGRPSGVCPPEETHRPLMEKNVSVPGHAEMALDLYVSSGAAQEGCAGAGTVSTATHQEEDLSALRAVFQALDQDGDGFVRIEEFMEFATAYGAEQVKDLTRFLDPSGLGVISFEDFHRGITAISNGGSDPELYRLQLSPPDGSGATEEYDEQAEVSDSAYLGSESAYSECETFTDEDTGALVHPELHEDVETDSGIENTLTENEERNRFSLGADLHGHTLGPVICGEEEHFEDFGESNSAADLMLANQEEGRAAPEGEGDPEPHPHPVSPLHRPSMRVPPSSSKRLSSKKAARHLLQSGGLDGMSSLSRDVLDLADSDITDKVLLLERRVCELEKDSEESEEQHTRLRQENLALVHRANALEEQLKEQELGAEENLQTLTRRHRDTLTKLQRERDLEIENLQARLHLLDEENSELRSCVPCLRANIERLEEEKRKLQDEMDDVSDRLNEEMESRRKMADKLSHEHHSNQKEKESTQELIEDLRKQLEHLQLFKLEMEARHGRMPGAGLQEYNTHMRENELEQEIRRLKQDNRSLKEQNDELNGQIINLSIQGAKSLFTESLSESLAAEINNVSRAELMEAIQKQEEINYRLQDYIDRIIVAIMESNPSILEVK
ncbi:rab11 family-interacting protein 3 isoform X2 [Electrophorus electricus]|uniref:rab11 family-interacting protein 3 isoform X2 n=1 Tax=Electrophorus electricus TaxID=8005 RepID=UPI0015CF8EA9|nr:rab11 family-interacting protein 3 isoform X2 [Electrophorus electricus]